MQTERDDVEEEDAAPSPPKTTKSDGKKGQPKRTQRRRKVRWLKPLERVTMLTKAGCSEKRIYRMMMESSEIAMSRRLTLRRQSVAHEGAAHQKKETLEDVCRAFNDWRFNQGKCTL
ncbi:Hypothetical protein PHPALM_16061 [Phytophthora palmivora]|uniref:Uncharacterized protein n=1 Tax=Phytophthora palmivora TaxID=4796 RepID=A0A2P4XQQ3_9STRA|nr:Hypothetical protein PHPALM_16061 [Phytophthora palmivora]